MKLLFFVILSAAVVQTSGRETGSLPPCSENSQSIPGWLWTAFDARWLPTDVRWAEEEGIVSLLVAALENQVQKQGTVCAVFMWLYPENWCCLCMKFPADLQHFCSPQALATWGTVSSSSFFLLLQIPLTQLTCKGALALTGQVFEGIHVVKASFSEKGLKYYHPTVRKCNWLYRYLVHPLKRPRRIRCASALWCCSLERVVAAAGTTGGREGLAQWLGSELLGHFPVSALMPVGTSSEDRFPRCCPEVGHLPICAAKGRSVTWAWCFNTH